MVLLGVTQKTLSTAWKLWLWGKKKGVGRFLEFSTAMSHAVKNTFSKKDQGDQWPGKTWKPGKVSKLFQLSVKL